GPIAREPQTINLPVAGAYTPGIFVTSDGSQLTQATGPDERLFLLSNRRFYDQGPDTAYAAGETGVAYRVEGDQEYTAQFAAGTYAKGDPLTVDSNGQLASAASGSVLVVAYYDGAGATLTAGDRDDIVIATNPHIGAA
ncbi:hypothetical protein, partial [uncultured Halomonas sp.]|uniref:hypothetical protein n=1 Tax=uncultured Halomonas sp. TaxID=173971 RepID=UPI0026256FD4